MQGYDTFLSPLYIGSGKDRNLVTPAGTGIDLKAYLELFRITKGICRYTDNFNPEIDTYLNV